MGFLHRTTRYDGWLSDMDIHRDIEKVLLAGAFGSYIDKERALAIGLLPPVSLGKISAVGNAAGAGAKVALASVKVRQTATEVAARG